MKNDPVLKTRTIPSHTKAYSLTMHVMGGLHYIQGNKAPYFSLTADIHRKGFPNQCQSGGCCHDLILKYYPQFADLAALHLCDMDGTPSGAASNGWYWLAGALPDHAWERYHGGNQEMHFPKPEGAPRKGSWDNTDYRHATPDEALDIFAKHVRIDRKTAEYVRDTVIAKATPEREGPRWTSASRLIPSDWKEARAWFDQWIEEQRPRWKHEANACIASHNLRVFGDPWPSDTEPAEQDIASIAETGIRG